MTITTRVGKGAPVTHQETDANFTELDSPRTAEKIVDGAITNAKLQALSVGEPELGSDAVTTNKIENISINQTHIASGSWTGGATANAINTTSGNSFTINPGATIICNGNQSGFGGANEGTQVTLAADQSLGHYVWVVINLSLTTANRGGDYLITGDLGRMELNDGNNAKFVEIRLRWHSSVSVGAGTEIVNTQKYACGNHGYRGVMGHSCIIGLAQNVPANSKIWMEVKQDNSNNRNQILKAGMTMLNMIRITD